MNARTFSQHPLAAIRPAIRARSAFTVAIIRSVIRGMIRALGLIGRESGRIGRDQARLGDAKRRARALTDTATATHRTGGTVPRVDPRVYRAGWGEQGMGMFGVMHRGLIAGDVT